MESNKVEYSMANDIYFDTNAFYEYIVLNGYSFGPSHPRIPPVNGTVFLEEIKKLEKENNVCFPAAVLFEVISHFRDEADELKSILSFLNDHFSANNVVFKINKNGPFYCHKNNTNKDVSDLVNPKITEPEIKQIVEEKIDSESRILSSFVYLISLAYVLCRYLNKPDYSSVAEPFQNVMLSEKSNNSDLVKNELKEKARTALKNAYDNKKEKKSFRKIFSDELALGIALLLVQLDCIRNSITGKKDETFFFSDTFGEGEKTIETICHNWSKDSKNITELSYFIDYVKEDIKNKGYSQVQADYIGNIIKDLFEHETKIDKNDATDFWLLSLSSNSSFLISFDEQMISAIQSGNEPNYDYIKRFIPS